MKLPINRQLSGWVTPWLKGLRLTPNQVTLLSLGVGLWGVWEMTSGSPRGFLLGALGFELSYLLDNCDGELARMTGRTSGLGSWLDLVTDCLIHVAFFFSLGVGLSRADSEPLWLSLGSAASVGVFLTYLTFFLEQLRQRGRLAWIHPDPPFEERDLDFGSRLRSILRGDFSLVVLGSALFGRMGWLLWGGVVGSSLYWVPSALSLAFQAKRWRERQVVG